MACDGYIGPTHKGIRRMRLSHAHHSISVRFDDSTLESCSGVVPVAALAGRAGLATLLERLAVPAANATTKVVTIVLGMVAGADSITDPDLLRHGAMRRRVKGLNVLLHDTVHAGTVGGAGAGDRRGPAARRRLPEITGP